MVEEGADGFLTVIEVFAHLVGSIALSHEGKHFLPVVVHEFGHSFGGLGDEYAYGNDDSMYFPDTEPWEPNLTTKATAFIKWEHLIKAGKAGLVEGGGYLEKGVWRGCENCRMRTNEEPEFCIVCREARVRLINFYTTSPQ